MIKIKAKTAPRPVGTTPVRRRPARWPRVTILLAATALLTSGLAACVATAPQLTGTCGVVVDGSGSGSQKTGFDAQERLATNFNTFLQNTDCKYVVFAPINGDSLSSVCAEPMLDMDPAGTTSDDSSAVFAQYRKAALQRAELELRCARYDKLSQPGASDIIGGLQRVQQELPAKAGPYNVLVVSDFISFDSNLKLQFLSLKTPAIRTAIIDRLKAEGEVPNLAAINIYAAGFGYLFGRNGQRRVEFLDFWDEYMAQAHAASFSPNSPY
jgi:hypothetical protein